MTRPRTRTTAALVVAMAIGGTAAATALAVANHRAVSPADHVRTAERTLLKAAVDGDARTAGTLLAPQAEVIDVLGNAETRRDYLATIAGGVDFVTIKPLTPIKVRLYGNTAVARLKVDFVVVAGPDTLHHRGWITDLLERRQGRWQVVWSQTTPVPNDPALLIRALKGQR